MSHKSTIPLLNHSLHRPSAFSPDSLIAAVREERGLKANRVPAVCVLEFDGDLTDWTGMSGAAEGSPFP